MTHSLKAPTTEAPTTSEIFSKPLLASLVGVVALTALAVTPAYAKVKPGNCAIYAEMTAATVMNDKRFSGEDAKMIAGALTAYAKAQSELMVAQMPDTYEASKAFGWDKAKVDEQVKAGEAAIRSGFRTSTMEENKVYMDHLTAVNNCALAAKSEAEMGQSKAEMVKALEAVYAVASKG